MPTKPLRIILQFLKTPAYFFLTLIISMAIFGPFFLKNPIEISNGPRLSAPSFDFLFGTDQYGMDILSRVVNGGRIDLFTGFMASFIAASIGMPLGALAAYKKGVWDQILLRTSESFQAFPVLILAMGTIAAIGSSMVNIIFVIAIVNVPV